MYSEKVQIEIGDRIRSSRKHMGKTQMEFSEDVFLTPGFLSEIENGKKGISCETLYNICEKESLSADFLLFGAGNTTDDMDTIIEIASKMKPDELRVVITYLESLWKMGELKQNRIASSSPNSS